MKQKLLSRKQTTDRDLDLRFSPILLITLIQIINAVILHLIKIVQFLLLIALLEKFQIIHLTQGMCFAQGM